MKEHSILFSGPMVRAILEGRKTQTRRVIAMKHHRDCVWRAFDEWPTKEPPYAWIECGNEMSGYDRRTPCPCICEKCPYGKPDDFLWVRESWAVRLDMDDVKIRDLSHSSGIFYWADGPGRCSRTGCNGAAGKKRPSIHMPRWASRLTLRITEVRVQRVRQISDDDISDEGMDEASDFATTWDSINAKRGYPWESNPWVWAISFERYPWVAAANVIKEAVKT